MNFHRFRIFIVSLILSLCGTAQPKNPLFYHVYADYGMTSDKTTVIHQDFHGYIWIGTEEGLNKFVSYADQNFDQYRSSRTDSTTLDNDYITALFEDSNRNLWIGSLTGLCRYNRNFDNFERICGKHKSLMNKRINAITEQNGQLWVATDELLYVYDYKSDSIQKTYEWENEIGKKVSFNALYTSKDHIWVGTSDGLYLIEEMKINPINGFEGLDITSISLSKESNLFIGTRNAGLYILNMQGEIVQLTTDTNPSIASNQVNSILTRGNGDIWIATNSGLTFYYPSTNTATNYKYDFNNVFGLSDHEVRHLYLDKSEEIWMTTPLGGINFFHESDNQFDYYGQKTSTAQSDELMDYNVLSMLTDKSNNELWIGSRAGLSKYSEDKDLFTHYPFQIDGKHINNQILSIVKDDNGIFWLGTEKGLFTWDIKTNNFRAVDDHPDFSDKINVVFLDNKNILWVGTQSKGLKRVGSQLDDYDIHFSIAEDKISLPNINDIFQLPDESIWVGTASGLFKVEGNKLVSRPIRLGDDKISNSWINYLCQSTSKELIVGTKQEGLIIIKENADQDEVMIDKRSGLPTNDIRSMTRINDNLVWVSTNSGLTKLTTDKDSVIKANNFYFHDGLQGKQFTPRAGVSLANKVYFGGLSGLTFFDPEKVKEFNLPLHTNITGLHINDKLIEPATHPEILRKAIGVIDTLILEPDQNNFTISYMAMDYLRPDSVKYRFMLENYDKNWLNTIDRSATYTNIPRGKQYTFKVQAISRFRTWSEPELITIYISPYFYETAWFKILVAFLIVGILFAVLRYREQSAVIKQRNLQRLVDIKTKELKLEVEAKEKTAVELERAKNDAEKANRIKSEFLANISHEIRTPLNGILGMSHLVSENEPNQENREMLNILGRSAESLREIIDDLLDLSKIEAGKFDIAVEEFNLPKLLEEIAFAFQAEANLKNVQLKTNIDSSIPTLLSGDELRIKQIVVNLLSNSLKFTESGTIDIIAELISSDGNGSKVFVGVKDTGIGIPEDKQEEIFSSFTQVESGSKRKYGGTGLGLAICKKLISLMGGKIWVESIPGEGAFFKFELPLKHVHQPENQGEVSPSLQIPEGKNILLVEDNAVNTMVAKKMLLKTNQRVDSAINGLEALKLAEQHKYDLILMDVQMPVMDGLEATTKIRKLKNGSVDSPIVALTAGAMQHDREKAMEVGMNDFLAKPINYDQLARMMAKYLNNPEEVPSMQR